MIKCKLQNSVKKNELFIISSSPLLPKNTEETKVYLYDHLSNINEKICAYVM